MKSTIPFSQIMGCTNNDDSYSMNMLVNQYG
jgi:hypothetical protein